MPKLPSLNFKLANCDLHVCVCNGGIVIEDIINLFSFILTYNISKGGKILWQTHLWVVPLGTSHSKYVFVIQI
jgi:hypothetical protein